MSTAIGTGMWTLKKMEWTEEFKMLWSKSVLKIIHMLKLKESLKRINLKLSTSVYSSSHTEIIKLLMTKHCSLEENISLPC